MRPSALMAALYPPAVRERWGAEISRQVSESGIGSWPDALLGAARLWLHPGDWPETSDGQTRQVLTVTLFAVTAATALLVRAAGQPVLTGSLRHPATSLWLAPILLGAALAAPAPPLRWRALRRLATVGARTLVGPAIAVAAMIVTANAGVLHHPAGPARIGLLVGYWAVLSFTAQRLCILTARYARTAHLPTTRRLRASAMLIGAGLSLAAGQSFIPLIWTVPGAGSLTLALALSLLAAATITAAHDLRT